MSLSAPFDVLLLAAALALLVLALRGRPKLWEVAAIAGLALLTARTGRSGVWLLLFLAVPAARGFTLSGTLRPVVARPTVAAFALLAVFGLVRGPAPTGASDEVLSRALAQADGTPILAVPLVAEQLADAGGRVWIANPLDAFRREDQALYLDWLQGRPRADEALARVRRVVVAAPDDPTDEVLSRSNEWERILGERDAVLYVRRPAGGSMATSGRRWPRYRAAASVVATTASESATRHTSP